MVAEPTVINDARPLIAMLAPMVALAAIVWAGEKRKNLREIFTLVAGVVQASVVLSLLPLVLAGNVVEFHIWQIFTNVPMLLRVDGFGLIFAAVASVLVDRHLALRHRLHAWSARARPDAFLFLFRCFPLRHHGRGLLGQPAHHLLLLRDAVGLDLPAGHPHAGQGGPQGWSHLPQLPSFHFPLFAVARPQLVLRLAGQWTRSDGFSRRKFHVRAIFRDTTQIVLLLLFTFGFAKAGLMPFHSWLPNAMVAPTPVSALLHAVAVVKVGVFCVIRVYSDIFGIEVLQALDGEQIMVWIACATIFISSLIALSQDNLKRRLAFSTIGQLGYVVLGATLATKQGMGGAVLHIAMHACGKITLFFCAGAILVASGKKYVSELRGLGRKMPFTMAAFLIGSLSVIGLPPLGGFVSKWYLVLGALDRDYVWVVVVLAGQFAPERLLSSARCGKRLLSQPKMTTRKERAVSRKLLGNAWFPCLAPPWVALACSFSPTSCSA